MARPPISMVKLSDTVTICECYADTNHKQGYWLHDKIQGMNLAMGEPSKEAALFKALEYYQKRFTKLKAEHEKLRGKVDSFLSQFNDDEE